MCEIFIIVLSVQIVKICAFVIASKQEKTVWIFLIFDGILSGAMNAELSDIIVRIFSSQMMYGETAPMLFTLKIAAVFTIASHVVVSTRTNITASSINPTLSLNMKLSAEELLII